MKLLTGCDDSNVRFVCRTILLILIIGLAARILIGSFMTHVYDMYHWGVVIQNIRSGNGLYEITGYFYSPPWGYILGFETLLQELFGIDVIGERVTEAFPLEEISWYYTATITTPGFNLAIKTMMIVSDVVVGYLIFWIIRDVTGDSKKSILGFALWFLCPFVILSGSVLGMFDTISVLLTLMAIILLRRDRSAKAGVMLCLATLMKFFPGFLVFIFLAYILRKHKEDGKDVIKSIHFLIGIAITAIVIMLPQMLDGTIADCFLFITSRLDSGTGTEVFASISGYAALLLYVVTFIVSVILSIRLYRLDDKDDLERTLWDILLIIMTIMFLYPPLPQYLCLLLPFVIFALVSDRRYLIPYCIIVIGASITLIAGGPTDLISIAVFTDILDMGSLMGTIGTYTSPLLGSMPLLIVGIAGSSIQYIGILSLLWVRFGERLKERFARPRDL